MKRIRLAQRRKTVGLSQERLAEIRGVDRSTVVRWERADTEPQPWLRPRLAKALKVSAEELAVLLADIGKAPSRPSERLDYLLTHPAGVDLLTADTPPRLGLPSRLVDSRGFDGGTAAARAQHLLAAFLAMEAELGGDQLYVPLAGHVDRLARLVANRRDPQLLRALGQLCQMTGWLAMDSNQHGSARRYLSTCVLVAHEADDPALAASALAYMSLQETYRDRPIRALALAQTALTVADNVTSRVGTMLATRLARAQAKLGDRQASLKALGAADEAFNSVDAEVEPLWISYVDLVELAAQKGACYLELAMYPQALASLTIAVKLIDTMKPTYVRDRVHYLSRIAKCHLASRNVEAACTVGHQAIDAALTLGSTRVLQRFSEFDAALAPHSAIPAARDFREQFALLAQAG